MITLVKKFEIETGRELHRHLEIGDTCAEIQKLPSETFNGISAYYTAEIVTPAQKAAKWFAEYNLNIVDRFGCIYKNESIGTAAATLGKLGGKSRSEAKIAAARENGKKGGRPKVVDKEKK